MSFAYDWTQVSQQLGTMITDLVAERALRVANVPAIALPDCLVALDACSAQLTTAQTALLAAITAVNTATTLIASHG